MAKIPAHDAVEIVHDGDRNMDGIVPIPSGDDRLSDVSTSQTQRLFRDLQNFQLRLKYEALQLRTPPIWRTRDLAQDQIGNVSFSHLTPNHIQES